MYKGTLIAVKNMEVSKKFYHDILDMNVAGDVWKANFSFVRKPKI